MRHLWILALTLVSGCSVGPDYAPSPASLSPAWRNASAKAASADPWWLAFKDPVLNRVEADALSANLDLEQALARVVQARGTLKGADAALLPGGEADAQYARVDQSLNSGLGQLSRYVPNFPRDVDNGQLSLSASWEIDFAGGLRRQREEARAQLHASQESYEAARIAISTDLADAYWALRGAQAQRSALLRVVAFSKEQAGFAIAHVRVGDSPAEISPRADALVSSFTSQTPALDALIEAERNRIAVLLARDPSAAFAELGAEGAIPDPPDPAAGQPADILRWRPDVVAAEDKLIAANAGIGAALAEYYPKVSLSGLLGQVTNHLSTITSGDSTFAQGVVGLKWRLFNFARIDADVRVARGGEREARAAYRQSVLLAAESVETSFSQLAATPTRLARLTAQCEALDKALAADRRAAQAGEISREALVAAEQAVARLDLDVAVGRQDVARATVACERAMGGATGAVQASLAAGAPGTGYRRPANQSTS